MVEEIFDHRKPDHGEGGWVRGLGSGIRFGVWGMGFGVWGLGVEVRGSGIGAWGSGLQTPAGTPDAIWGSWRCLEARATPGGLQTPSGVLGVSGGTSPLGPRASRPHLECPEVLRCLEALCDP